MNTRTSTPDAGRPDTTTGGATADTTRDPGARVDVELDRRPVAGDVEADGWMRAAANPHRVELRGTTDDRGHDRFESTWPVQQAEAIRLLVAAIVVAGTGILTGWLLTDRAAPNTITRLDERVADWFADGRTSALNSFSTIVAFPADTIPKIAISAFICGFFLWRWRRWDEAVYVALPLVFEALCFITITRTVQRPRPEVDHVVESTIDSSFPSGHVAAATVYVAVVIVVFRRTTAVRSRALAVGVFVLVALGVTWARLYQGVHYASDVLAGIILGAISVVITDWVLRRRHGESVRRTDVRTSPRVVQGRTPT